MKKIKNILLLLMISGSAAGQTHFTKHDNNPVIQSANSSWDAMGAFSPSVVFVNDTLKMWYGIQDTSSLLCQCCSADPPYDINQPKQQIAYGWTLADTVNWQIHANGPVLSPDTAAWDSIAVESADVVYDTAAPDSTRYKMWFTGHGNNLCDSSEVWQIGYAYSPDGISWTKYSGNPVMESYQPAGNATRNDNALKEPSVLIDQNAPASERYKMWYSGIDQDAPVQEIHAINYAWSADGITWTKSPDNPVITSGTSGSWEEEISDPEVVIEGSLYHLWYTGEDATGSAKIGYASSSDGVSWNRSSANPVLKTGDSCDFDAGNLEAPSALLIDSVYHLWYQGSRIDSGCSPISFTAIGYANSATIAEGVAMEVANKHSMQAFPNPFNEVVYFKDSYYRFQSPEITIYDCMGKIKSLPYGLSGNKITLNTSTLPSGIYFFSIRDKHYTSSGKLIKY